MLLSEALNAPFDEGIKNIVFSLYKQLERRNNIYLVTKEGNRINDIKNIIKINLNKSFFNIKLSSLLKKITPQIVLYIPLASCSFYSFIRAKVLKLMDRRIRVVLLCVQHREYSVWQKIIIKAFLKPDLILLLGRTDESCFQGLNIKTKVLLPAIDTTKFYPVDINEKKNIRNEFGIPQDKKIILHVGHIRESRNLDCFFNIQKQPDIQVIIVASSTWGEDIDLKSRLKKAGIYIIDRFISDISKIYKMADIYIFPVKKKTGATEMPLSVIEAMACNLPIITTRYGGLIDFFREDKYFRYFDHEEEIIPLINDILKDINNISNYRKVASFTWKRFADSVLSACEEL